MKKLFFAVFIFTLAICCFGQTEKEKAILQLLELTDSKAQIEQVFDLLIPQMKPLVPSVSDEIWEMFKNNMKLDDLIKDFIPLYDKYYTLEEIKEMIAFYESPLGRKMIRLNPQWTVESMALGQAWGHKIAEKLINSLRSSGYLDA